MNLYDEILRILQEHTAAHQEVRLINDYKGFPIANSARVLSVKDSEVVLKADPYQMVCMHLEKQAFIYSEKLPSVVRARVGSLDFPAGLAALSHFAYTKDTIGKRLLIRVQPDLPIQVIIAAKDRKVRGSLADISENGIGIYTLGAFSYNVGILQRDSTVRLILKLSADGPELVVSGTVTNIQKEQDSYRMGIATSPDEITRDQISRFISRRQAEIIAELRRLYEKLCAQPPSPDGGNSGNEPQ